MKQRIKQLREAVGLSQTDFGKRIGLARNTIANYEGGTREPNEAVIKLICKEFSADYFWLTEGTGEMFTSFPDTIVDEVVDEFNLDANDRVILEAYLGMKESEREVIKTFLLSIAEKAKKNSDGN